MAGIGVVLFVAGLLLSNVTWPADKHGDHHAVEKQAKGHQDHATGAHEATHSDAAHSVAPGGDSAHADDANAVSEGGEQHNADEHGASHIFKFTSEGGEHAKAEAHGDGHHAHESDHQEGATWRRAYLHEGQEIMGHHVKGPATTGAKIGASLLMSSFWWSAVALFGVFFIAVGYVANAGWYLVVKRILENYYRFLPIGAALLLITYFAFGKDIWEWVALPENVDALIDGKRAFLNLGFILGTAALLFGLVYPFVGHMYKKNSLAEEAEGGTVHYFKSVRMSAMFLPVFALGFAFTCFLWLMSVDPHWFSTIYAVYCFAGLFVSGMTVTMFIATHLQKHGYLPSMTSDHLHDIGKFMFAFCVFWAYIWISQYLLIWYANIPEETIYYWSRLQNYPLLFGLKVAVNCVFPFIAMMTRNAKRQADSLRSVGRVILVGRFFDIYLLIAPAVLGADGGFTTMLMAAGAMLVVGAIFLFVVFSGFMDAPMEARKHPFFEETTHHNTGV